MSTQNESDQKQLTIDDPVDPATMSQFANIHQTRIEIGHRMVQLELEKVRLLRAYSGLETEEQKIFEKVLTARGLPPNIPVEIIAGTGKIKLRMEEGQTPMGAPVGKAPVPSS